MTSTRRDIPYTLLVGGVTNSASSSSSSSSCSSSVDQYHQQSYKKSQQQRMGTFIYKNRFQQQNQNQNVFRSTMMMLKGTTSTDSNPPNNDDTIDPNNNDDDTAGESLLYYDDFDGISIGTTTPGDDVVNDQFTSMVLSLSSTSSALDNDNIDSSTTTSSSSINTVQLLERIQQVQRREEYDQKSIQRNWILGNWNVQCIPLLHSTTSSNYYNDLNDLKISLLDKNTTTTTNEDFIDKEDKAMMLLIENPDQDQTINDIIDDTNKFKKLRSSTSQSQPQQQQKQPIVSCIIPATSTTIVDDNNNDDDDDDDDDDDEYNVITANKNNKMWISWDDGTVQLISLASTIISKSSSSSSSSSEQASSYNNDIDVDTSSIAETTEALRKDHIPIVEFQASTNPITAMTTISSTMLSDVGQQQQQEPSPSLILYTASFEIVDLSTNTGKIVIQQWNVFGSTTSNDDDEEEEEEKDDDSTTVTVTSGKKFYVDDTMITETRTDCPFVLKIIQTGTTTDRRLLLLSVSASTFTVYDIKTGTTIYSSKHSADYDIITSADTDGTNYIYLGTSNGTVIVYSVHDILLTSTSVDANVPPCGQWSVSSSQDGTNAITTILYGGIGTMGQRGRSTTISTNTIVLYTGTSRGIIQKWELFQRQSSSSSSESKKITIEQWPKIPSQKIPNSAHIFSSKSNVGVKSIVLVSPKGSVNSFSQQQQQQQQPVGYRAGTTASSTTYMIVAYDDGTIRLWNVQTGKELYIIADWGGNDETVPTTSTTSISPIRNVWLIGNDKNVLVSDASIQSYDSSTTTTTITSFLCIHDFSIDNPEDDDNADYELDMPNYYQQ